MNIIKQQETHRYILGIYSHAMNASRYDPLCTQQDPQVMSIKVRSTKDGK